MSIYEKKTARWIRGYVELIRDPKLSDGAVRVLLVLRSYCKRDGDSCFPATRTLQQDLGCSRSALFRSFAELEKHGWLRRAQRKRKNGSFTTCTFTLLDERKASVREAFKSTSPSAKYGTRLRKPSKRIVRTSENKGKILAFPASHG